jgi:hypothetical protein
MFLLEEIVLEIAMIAAVVVAVVCLAYLLQVSVREQAYLRRLRRERETAESALVTCPRPQDRRTAKAAPRSDRAAALREKRA